MFVFFVFKLIALIKTNGLHLSQNMQHKNMNMKQYSICILFVLTVNIL